MAVPVDEQADHALGMAGSLPVSMHAEPGHSVQQLVRLDVAPCVACRGGGLEDGSREVVGVALLGRDGPTGTFTRGEDTTIPW